MRGALVGAAFAVVIAAGRDIVPWLNDTILGETHSLTDIAIRVSALVLALGVIYVKVLKPGVKRGKQAVRVLDIVGGLPEYQEEERKHRNEIVERLVKLERHLLHQDERASSDV